MPEQPSQKDYEAAKARQAKWTDEDHADPSDEVLADVELIRVYERMVDLEESGE